MKKEYICKECGGSGYVAQGKYFQGFGDSMQGICCPSCNGTGHMRKEFVCKECGGHATKEYYQENPDCKQCPEYEGCSGAINGYCLISSKDSCPSCQDSHIPLEKHIEALIAYEKESE